MESETFGLTFQRIFCCEKFLHNFKEQIVLVWYAGNLHYIANNVKWNS